MKDWTDEVTFVTRGGRRVGGIGVKEDGTIAFETAVTKDRVTTPTEDEDDDVQSAVPDAE